MGAALDLGILGPLEVRIDGGAPVALGGTRQRALLAVLALHANAVVSADRLIDLLWGESPPATASHTVQVFVSRLRRALASAGDRLVTRAPGYMLHLGVDELDADRCERLYMTASSLLETGDAPRAASLLREAIALWRGPALAEFTYEPFAQAAIARLEERRLSCHEGLLEAELALGRHAELIPELQALVREHQFRERPWAQLMLALYRCGRQADALDAYREARQILVNELAVEPGPLLRDLEQAILRQDPLLAAPCSPAATASPAPTAPPAPTGLLTTAALALAAAEDEAPTAGRGFETTIRKTATVLVARLATGDSADPETAKRLIAAARAELELIASRHGGLSVRGAGAEIVGLFGVPLTREDDALRAVRAAQELRAAIAERSAGEPTQLLVRIGLDTGEVVADAPDDVFGEPLGGAEALALVAQPGDVLLSEATRRLASAEIRAESALDGNAWRLLGLSSGPSHPGAELSARMIDRKDEMLTARAVFTRTVRERNAHVLIITGDAGVGKSRLARELIEGLRDDATVLVGRCLSYGEGVAFWPLREALTSVAGGSSRDAIRSLIDRAPDADLVADIVADVLGLADADAASEQVPWAFRRLLDELATLRPVVLAIDDAHSAGLPLLKLVNELVDWLTAPVLFVCLARPELFDPKPDWGMEDPRPDWGKHARVETLKLAPLRDEDALALLNDRVGDSRLTEAERDHIVATADGNPLFVEQLLAMRSEAPRWHEDLVIPPTIQSLLAARLDRLGPGERAFIQRAALIGREFWSEAVAELLPREARASAPEHLRALVRRGLIEPARGGLAGKEELRFHHILIRDVAYRTTPKMLRGELHERFADWLAGRGEGYEEIVGYHLEQAYRYRGELAAPSEDLHSLACRAGSLLAAGGRRAVSRGDAKAGANLMFRARYLFESARQPRPELLLDLGNALIEGGEFAEAQHVLTDALEAAQSVNDEGVRARALIELSDLRGVLDASALAEETEAVANEAIAVFKRLRDEAGLARALLHVADVHWTRCHFADMEDVLERALKHADRAGARREQSLILGNLARAAVTGPRPVEDAILRCEAIYERADEDLVLSVVAQIMLAVLDAMRGHFDDSRRRWGHARARLEEVGRVTTLSLFEMYHALIELLAGTPANAQQDLERAYALLERSPERSRLATISALLARLHGAQDRWEEAGRYCRASEEVSTSDDVVSQGLWRAARATMLARDGDTAAALELANSAVALAQQTDFLMLHALTLADRAGILETADQQPAALADLDAAIALYERKGMQPAAAAARATRQGLLARSSPAAGWAKPPRADRQTAGA